MHTVLVFTYNLCSYKSTFTENGKASGSFLHAMLGRQKTFMDVQFTGEVKEMLSSSKVGLKNLEIQNIQSE
jgi:hypothetical protein